MKQTKLIMMILIILILAILFYLIYKNRNQSIFNDSKITESSIPQLNKNKNKNINIVNESIEMARSKGVKEKDIIKNIDELDTYMKN